MDYKKNRQRGSLVVEAAVFLPLFIIGILTLGYLLKTMYIQEAVHHLLVDEAKKTAAEAYVHSIEALPEGVLKEITESGLDDYLLFKYRINKRLENEDARDIRNFKISRFGYSDNNLLRMIFSIGSGSRCTINADDLIDIKIDYDVRIPFAVKYRDKLHISQRLVFRGWTGTKKNIDAMPFDEMEQDEKSDIVYVFPKAGEKYHRAACKFITNTPVEKILTQSIMKQYRPCELCNAEKAAEGSTVYLYEKSGNVYHLKNCPLVDKYVVKMELRDAVSKGYKPCLKCKPPKID